MPTWCASPASGDTCGERLGSGSGQANPSLEGAYIQVYHGFKKREYHYLFSPLALSSPLFTTSTLVI